ncbi:MAG: hypothetical protein OWR62_01480 [Sulfobacillus thermotolerans]|nr:hypothetical protein [Sulfobacillus thermotolerans]
MPIGYGIGKLKRALSKLPQDADLWNLVVALCDVPEPPPASAGRLAGRGLRDRQSCRQFGLPDLLGGLVNGLRQRLQQKRTKSGKRLLKRRRHKKQHLAANENHGIAKQVVTQAAFRCSSCGSLAPPTPSLRATLPVGPPSTGQTEGRCLAGTCKLRPLGRGR